MSASASRVAFAARAPLIPSQARPARSRNITSQKMVFFTVIGVISVISVISLSACLISQYRKSRYRPLRPIVTLRVSESAP